MTALLRRIAIRLAGCCLLVWVNIKIVHLLGLPVALAWIWVAPMVGIALAKPLIELASDIRHEMRRANWAPVEGRHYAFRGVTVRVVDDDSQQRWVHLADIRRIAGYTAGDNTLQVAYAAGFRRIAGEAHLNAEALLTHLGKEKSPAAIKLRHWIEREIVFPARRQRATAQRRIRSTSDVVE